MPPVPQDEPPVPPAPPAPPAPGEAEAAEAPRLPSLRVASRILFGGAALFAVWMACFPLLGPAYTPIFRGGIELLGKLVLDDSLGGVKAIPVVKHHAPDTRVSVIRSRFRDPRTGNQMVASYYADVGSYHHGYMPFMVFASLLLVTRLPWKRKLRPFLLGTLWVHLFVALRVVTAIYYAHVTATVNGARLQDRMNPTAVFLVEAARNLLCDDHLTAFVIPILIWSALLLIKPALVPESAASGAAT